VTATNLTGTLQTASQTNITSVGTLTSLDIDGDLTVDTDVLVVDSTNNNVSINEVSITNDLIVDTDTLYVDSTNDRVGINTNPSYPLDVVGDINTSTDYNINGVRVLSSSALGEGIFDSSLTSVGTLTSLDIDGDLTVNDALLVVDSTNNRVGINITNPSYDMDVVGDINFTGDIYSNGVLFAGDSLWIQTGNDAYIGVTGDVAIGTTNITQKLNIHNDSNSYTVLHVTNGNTTDSISNGLDVGLDSVADGLIWLREDNDIKIATNSTERVRITNTGNVGIGTDTPSGTLDVNGTTILRGSVFTDSLNFNIDYSSGHVGINQTVNASYTLAVNGDINIGILDEYLINGTSVLNSTTLGSGIINSSLTSVGTLSSLDVSGDFAVNTDTLYVDTTNDIVLINKTTQGDSNSNFEVSGTSLFTNRIGVGMNSNTNGNMQINLGDVSTGFTNNSGTIDFYSGGSVKMTLASDGDFAVNTDTLFVDNSGSNVGIGTTTPNSNSLLHIEDTSSDVELRINAGDNDPYILFDGSSEMYVGYNSGTFNLELGQGTIFGSNVRHSINTSGTCNFHSGDGSNSTAGVIFRKSATDSTSNRFLEFYRSASDITSGTSEGYVRIDGSGNLAFENASDRRLKKNITEYKDGLNIIKGLRSVKYDWIDEEKPNDVKGFIAQEVLEYLPKSVGGNETEDDHLTISTVEMIPVMWSAMREMMEKVESLEEEVRILKLK
jgi:hypothetical protein